MAIVHRYKLGHTDKGRESEFIVFLVCSDLDEVEVFHTMRSTYVQGSSRCMNIPSARDYYKQHLRMGYTLSEEPTSFEKAK